MGRRGQSAVEYMLALSVIAIVIAGAFSAMGAGVGGAFHNVRAVVGLPYP
jgi:Flp pilus assembly pilin Flp